MLVSSFENRKGQSSSASRMLGTVTRMFIRAVAGRHAKPLHGRHRFPPGGRICDATCVPATSARAGDQLSSPIRRALKWLSLRAAARGLWPAAVCLRSPELDSEFDMVGCCRTVGGRRQGTPLVPPSALKGLTGGLRFRTGGGVRGFEISQILTRLYRAVETFRRER